MPLAPAESVAGDSWPPATHAMLASENAVASVTRSRRRAIRGPSGSRPCQITTMTHATRDDEPRDLIAGVAEPDTTRETELRATTRLALPVVLVQIGMMFMGV